MSLPPKNLEAYELFAQITAVPRQVREVDFPRNDAEGKPLCKIGMVVLNQSESIAASAAAKKKTDKMLANAPASKDDRGYNDVYNSCSASEVLYRACKNPKTNAPFFPSVESISDALSNDEIGVLLNHYLTMQLEIGPVVGLMTDEEMEAWIERLAEGGESAPFFLNSFSWEAQKQLIVYMACQLMKCQMDISSLTSQLNEQKSAEKQEMPVQ